MYKRPMRRRLRLVACLALVIPAACRVHSLPAPTPTPGAGPIASATGSPSAAASSVAATAVREAPLPSGSGPASFDFITYEPARARVWIPSARDGGAVDVYDVAKGTFTRIGGFPVTAQEVDGKKRLAGPSSAAIGDGVVYIGNRSTSEVCPVDAATLVVGACFELSRRIDAVVYVPSVKEVWVTTPNDRAITVLDASKPAALQAKTVIAVDGAPEGWAVDESRGLFFTNLEDANRTLVIDVKSHAVKASFAAGCNADGPRGLGIDPTASRLFLACTDRVRVLDLGHEEALVSELDTGAGVDNVDYLLARRLLYVAAGKAGRLTVAHLDDDGRLTPVASTVTATRARNAVADPSGTAYLIDPAAPRLLIVAPPP
ncbi:MAG: hypothetical protein NVSMB47_03580 [Polyangiales bacterium]